MPQASSTKLTTVTAHFEVKAVDELTNRIVYSVTKSDESLAHTVYSFATGVGVCLSCKAWRRPAGPDMCWHLAAVREAGAPAVRPLSDRA